MVKLYKGVYWFIGAMIMAWLGNYFYDQTKSIPVLNYITGFLNWLFEAGAAILNYKLKVWLYIVSMAAIFGLLILYAKITETGGALQPDFIKYKKDTFKRWIWRWDWQYVNNAWKIIHLTPYCPKDDVQLIECGSFLRKEYYCPKCNTQYNEWNEPVENRADAEVLILDKVNKKNYRTD